MEQLVLELLYYAAWQLLVGSNKHTVFHIGVNYRIWYRNHFDNYSLDG